MTFGFLSALQQAPPGQPSSTPGQPGGVEIRDIAPPVDVFPYPLWQVAIVAAVALILLALLGWWIARRMANRPVSPPPSPRAVALRALEELRGMVQKLEPYAFSIAVSDVLRHFMDGQYGFRAERQTSPEFLASISQSATLTPEDRRLLADFLERCDLIKFARVSGDEETNRALLESAGAFVQGGRA